MAQCSPNLYCIDRFTHMQRERGREAGREAGREEQQKAKQGTVGDFLQAEMPSYRVSY